VARITLLILAFGFFSLLLEIAGSEQIDSERSLSGIAWLGTASYSKCSHFLKVRWEMQILQMAINISELEHMMHL